MNQSHDPLESITIESPVGPLTLVASPAGLRAVLWPTDGPERVPLGAIDAAASSSSNSVLAAATSQLCEYFDGERQDFDVDLDPVGTDFQRDAWTALRTIPFAGTVSYGEQADRMGDKRKARAVGAANGRNPISIIVPCHRVVGANGSLTGFAGGIDTKQWLLAHEQRVAGNTLL
ncbi:MAG: methylated-DNA--[protein]-cysteine S-methyltransferase [Ilumatobacter sp.]